MYIMQNSSVYPFDAAVSPDYQKDKEFDHYLEKSTIKDTFIHFLKSKNVFNEFNKKLDDAGKSLSEYILSNIDEPMYLVNSAFYWRDDESGTNWREIDDLWMNEIKGMV